MLLVSALMCLIFLYNSRFASRNDDNQNQAAGRELAVLLGIIEENFICDFDARDVTDAALRAAVEALGDRWSFYLTPDEYAEYLNNASNHYTGIGVGVVIDEETGQIEVIYTYRGSPAEKAGVLAGDVITEVDGESLIGVSLDDMRELLARPIGETAELTVLRSDGSFLTISVVYDYVFTDPIDYEMLEDDIGYVYIANFEGSSANSFISAISSLLDDGARAFVFDVRGNGGGRVSEMTRMLDYLLPEGEIFVSVGKDGVEDVTWSDSDMLDVPVVVIVDRYSFSAAEYFAATLKEYGYAEIVGEQTTGKSRSQLTLELPDGGALHISTSQYLTKNRVALAEVGGVTPDHLLALNDEEFNMLLSGTLEKADDPQLQLALSLLNM